VTLSFNNRMERLTIPLAAITTFADPSVKFGLQFEAPAEVAVEELETAVPKASPAALPTGENRVGKKPADDKNEAERPAAEVVTLDRFRKR
jgi:hypothetical protein